MTKVLVKQPTLGQLNINVIISKNLFPTWLTHVAQVLPFLGGGSEEGSGSMVQAQK